MKRHDKYTGQEYLLPVLNALCTCKSYVSTTLFPWLAVCCTAVAALSTWLNNPSEVLYFSADTTPYDLQL